MEHEFENKRDLELTTNLNYSEMLISAIKKAFKSGDLCSVFSEKFCSRLLIKRQKFKKLLHVSNSQLVFCFRVVVKTKQKLRIENWLLFK